MPAEPTDPASGPGAEPTFLQRLKERKLVQWALAYLAGAWVIYEATGTALEAWDIPLLLVRSIHVLLFFGLFVTLIVAWYHGEKGQQRVSGPELLMVVALLLLAGVALSKLGPRSEMAPASLIREGDDRPGIAVLPCENISPNPNDAFFAAGLHEEILLKLSKISSILSIGRESVEWYRDNPYPIPEIARQLGVGFLGECSVRKDPTRDRVRLTFQLLDATGVQLWADNYDRNLTAADLFDIQSDIAQGVVRATRAVLLPHELAEVEVRPTENLQAYEYYLRGNAHLDRGIAEGEADRAAEFYERAVEEDPGFALAWADLSVAHSVRQWMHGGGQEAGTAAREAAETALRLDPDLSEAHRAMGYTYYYGSRDFEAALEEFEIARRLRPNDPGVLAAIAFIFRRQGRWAEAISSLERAVELEPRNAVFLNNLGNMQLWVREYEDAIRYHERATSAAPEIERPYLALIQLYLSKGDVEVARRGLDGFLARFGSEALFEALGHADSWARSVFVEEVDRAAGALVRPHSEQAAWILHMVRSSAAVQRGENEFARVQADSARILAEWWVEESPTSPQARSQLGLTYASLGRDAEAVREGRAAVRILPVSSDARRGPVYRLNLALIYVITGDHESAMDQLDYLLSIPSVLSVPLLRVDPVYDPLRDHPRFQALLEKYAGNVGH